MIEPTLTEERLVKMGLTSYERQLLVPAMTNDCLIGSVEYCLKNVTLIGRVGFPVTYEEALINTYVPELLRRLQQ